MSEGLIAVSYIGAMILFILALGGLSQQETAKRGNYYGMIGMAIAIVATVSAPGTTAYPILLIAMAIGGTIGFVLAMKVEMTQMPELVACLHSLVGLAAVLIGFANFIGGNELTGIEASIHKIEIYIGIFIGAITFSGSVIAFCKLSGKVSGSPLLLPARHWLNLALVVSVIWVAGYFLDAVEMNSGILALLIMTLIALLLGIHMVMAIGGADMPVVVSMLNSYSGWAAAATGFMLNNDLLIATGALVGSSGAILSYIMCRAMNRHFISVIAGGFGTATSLPAQADGEQGEVQTVNTDEVVRLLLDAKEIMIIPGYGMAVAQAQHTTSAISKFLQAKGSKVRFGIHPVAGRMPGHMNVLLAEARIPYDIVFEMDEINEDFPNIDVSIVIGANDIVNPSALDDPDSPIAGMPVLECWRGKTTIVLKRSMATGYAGIQNPLFFKENTLMYFGDAKENLEAAMKQLG